MEGFIISIIGAFGGGAILSQLVAHWLRRRERREAQQEEAERRVHSEMREMLMERVRDCTNIEVHMLHIRRLLDLRDNARFMDIERSLLDLKEQRGRDQSISLKHQWEPYRIGDVELRALADELNELLIRVESDLLTVMATTNPDEFFDKLRVSTERIRQLQQQITVRLDELGW